jgi:hypothetical protein
MKKIIVIGVMALFIIVGFQPAYANDVSIRNAEQQPRGEEFIKTFGGSDRDYGFYVEQTTDGGYIIVSTTYSFGTWESCDVWLIKTDSNGNKIWDKTYGGTYNEYGTCVQQITDGGYIITGYQDDHTHDNDDIWLIRTDSVGNKIWYKSFGGRENDRGEFVQQTTDGGYIIVGGTESYGHVFYSDVWLIKADSNGNMEWNKTFGDVLGDWGECVQQTSDGGYIITGTTEEFGEYNDDIFLIKTDNEGNKLWDKILRGQGNNDDNGEFVQQTSDGGYIITGSTYVFGLGFGDVWLIKTDSSGNILWDKKFGGIISYDDGYCVRQTNDGGYIITGVKQSFMNYEEEALLIKTDENGNKIWDRRFGAGGRDTVNCVQQTTDGGYIMVGTTDSFGDIDGDVWLIKTNKYGRPRNIILSFNKLLQTITERFPLLGGFLNSI